MNQSMRKSISLIVLSSLSILAATLLTAESIKTAESTKTTESNPAQIKWLGISLDQITPALRSQLSSQLKDGTGVMITGVQSNSPAEKAGLQAFDILTSFNKTTVSNSQQVYDLVQQSSADDTIKLEYIRAGKKQTAEAKIGSREISNQQNWNQPFQGWPNANRFGGWPNFNNDPFWNSQPRWNHPFFQNFHRDFNRDFNNNFPAPFYNFPNMPNFPDFPKDFGKNFNGNNVQSFSQSESLSIKTLPDGKIHVELKSKDTDDNEKNFVFEGKRDQIIKDIQQQKDLPDAQKQKLIGAIQGSFSSFFNNGSQDNLFPPIPNGPFSQPLEQQKPPKRLNY